MKISISSSIVVLDCDIPAISRKLASLPHPSNTQTKDFEILEIHSHANVTTSDILKAEYFKGISTTSSLEVRNLNVGKIAAGWYSKEPLRACDFINGRASGVRVNDTGILVFASCSVFSFDIERYGKTKSSLSLFPGDRICTTPVFVAAARVRITKV